MGGGGYSSNYGDVTIAKSMKKYKRVCPEIIIHESNNPDPGKPDCPGVTLN
jgi:hypothetical protein